MYIQFNRLHEQYNAGTRHWVEVSLARRLCRQGIAQSVKEIEDQEAERKALAEIAARKGAAILKEEKEIAERIAAKQTAPAKAEKAISKKRAKAEKS